MVKKAAAALRSSSSPSRPRILAPRTAGRSRACLEAQYGMFLASTGAAVNALGELQIETASKTLILSLYRTPELASQIRRALVASGPKAKEELKKVLLGQNAEVEQLFRDKKLDKYCGDKGELPADQCQPVSLKDFYAALCSATTRSSRTPAASRARRRRCCVDDQPGPTQHTAVFDAIRQARCTEAAPKLRALWMKRLNDLQTRTWRSPRIVASRGRRRGVDELGKIAPATPPTTCCARRPRQRTRGFANDPKHVAPLQVLASKCLDAAAKQRAAAEPSAPARTPPT
jgi:hypothetical protein